MWGTLSQKGKLKWSATSFEESRLSKTAEDAWIDFRRSGGLFVFPRDCILKMLGHQPSLDARALLR